MDVPVSYYLVLSGIVFSIGLVGVLIRRNIIIILLSIELMLNATNINFVAFSSYLGNLVWSGVRVFCAYRGCCGGRGRVGDYHRPLSSFGQYQH